MKPDTRGCVKKERHVILVSLVIRSPWFPGGPLYANLVYSTATNTLDFEDRSGWIIWISEHNDSRPGSKWINQRIFLSELKTAQEPIEVL